MSNFLRPLRPGVFQVFINDTVAAIIVRSAFAAFDVFILTSEVVRLAEEVIGSPQDVALRIASGEFDNDFRFDISPEADEDGNYSLIQIATPSQQEMYRNWMTDPYGFVQAEREVQAERREMPELEDRFNYYAEMGL